MRRQSEWIVELPPLNRAPGEYKRRAGVMFSEDRNDLRLGEARLAHMSFLFRPFGQRNPRYLLAQFSGAAS